MGTFTVGLAQFVQKTKANADQVVRQACLSLDRGVVMRTPVDTGRARANWQLTINQPATTDLPTTDRSGTSTIAKALAAVQSAHAGDTVWIMNNLPCAQRLENGWSGQAPQGMVRLTVNEFRKYVDQAAKAVQ